MGGLAVAGKKVLQPRHVAERGRADQDWSADAALDQADAAQDQRAHDALAEIGFRDQERAQLVRRNQKRFDIALGMAIDQRDAAGKLADFRQKLPRSLVDHRRDVAKAVTLGDCDIARQQHEHARPGSAGFEQGFAVLVATHLPEPAHAVDFVLRQGWKSLLVARKCKRTRTRLVYDRNVCRHLAPAYPSVRLFPLASSREASRLSEDALAGSLRPLACDFRRLRFSRSASFNRSCRESFAAAPCRSALSRSSVIARPVGNVVACSQNSRWLKPAHGHCNGEVEPELARVDAAQARRGRRNPILAVLVAFPSARVLAPAGALWQEPAACRGLFGRFLDSRACCRSSVVEHSIGNGEVDSSILSGSTIPYRWRPFPPAFSRN